MAKKTTKSDKKTIAYIRASTDKQEVDNQTAGNSRIC